MKLFRTYITLCSLSRRRTESMNAVVVVVVNVRRVVLVCQRGVTRGGGKGRRSSRPAGTRSADDFGKVARLRRILSPAATHTYCCNSQTSASFSNLFSRHSPVTVRPAAVGFHADDCQSVRPLELPPWRWRVMYGNRPTLCGICPNHIRMECFIKYVISEDTLRTWKSSFQSISTILSNMYTMCHTQFMPCCVVSRHSKQV